MVSNPITAQTPIDNGLKLTENFLLEHVSAGAYHPKMNMWLPIFSSKLIPSNFNNMFTPNGIPLWLVAKNLQLSAQGILESLFIQMGSDLIIRAGYSNMNKSAVIGLGTQMNTLGLSFDVQVRNYEDNPYVLCNDILKLANRASSIQLTYGSGAWFKIETTPNRLMQPGGTLSIPTFNTVDLDAGILEKGITSIR